MRGRIFAHAACGTGAYLIGQAARWSRRRAGIALVYHEIANTARDPGRRLLPAAGISQFEGQLAHLRNRYRIVPASELLDAVRGRKRGERFPVAITFDDDLHTHVQVAMPILQRLRIPATFFLCGASLTRPFAFWWERLQAGVDRGMWELVEGAIMPPSLGASTERPPRDIRVAAMRLRSMAPDQRDEAAKILSAGLGADPYGAGMRERDVRALVDAGFEIGFHTLRHDPLSSLGASALGMALNDGRPQLSEITGGELRLIAYPHGDANTRIAAAAQDAGFQFGFTTAGEAVTDRTDPMLIGRVTPTRRSTSHFALQLAGALIGRCQS